MKKYVPELHVAYQYMNSNKQSMSVHFGKITVSMETLSKFSVTMNWSVKKIMFSPNLHLVSVISFWTLSMICYIKTSVHNLGEFPLLANGTYVGSLIPGTPNKYDMIELQMPTTEEDRRITEQMHRVTKMRDTMLVSCGSLKQPNMLEREVIVSIYFWMERPGEIDQ